MKTLETLCQLAEKVKEKNYVDENFTHNLSLFTFHSTAIEGATLSVIETQNLIEKDITANGKSLSDHLMVKDHHEALLFTLQLATKREQLTIEHLKIINALVNKHKEGYVENVVGKVYFNSGEFRKSNVKAGETVFMNYSKVLANVIQFLDRLNKNIQQKDIGKIYELSFEAHFNVVNIHPWLDGNGRTSRLIMNYIQEYHQLPKTFISKDDRNEYIAAIIKTRETNNKKHILDFCTKQGIKAFKQRLGHDGKSKKGMSFLI